MSPAALDLKRVAFVGSRARSAKGATIEVAAVSHGSVWGVDSVFGAERRRPRHRGGCKGMLVDSPALMKRGLNQARAEKVKQSKRKDSRLLA